MGFIIFSSVLVTRESQLSVFAALYTMCLFPSRILFSWSCFPSPFLRPFYIILGFPFDSLTSNTSLVPSFHYCTPKNILTLVISYHIMPMVKVLQGCFLALRIKGNSTNLDWKCT